jgi:plasmid stabilization system protein ParE
VATRFAKGVLNAVRRARDFPDIGTPLRELDPAGTYRAVLAIWYYRVVYRVDGEIVWIVRIWDSRRDPSTLVTEDANAP